MTWPILMILLPNYYTHANTKQNKYGTINFLVPATLHLDKLDTPKVN